MDRDVVLRSLEDQGGDRCVDLVALAAGGFAWVECRRDPEDPFGWRRIGVPVSGFPSEDAALRAAVEAVGWLDDEDRT